MSTTDITIRSFHTDCFGHVHHARYLELLEEARWQYFEDIPGVALDLHAADIRHAVVRIDIAYRKEARLGDVLRIETAIAGTGNSSVSMFQNIFQSRTGAPVVSATITNVYYRSSLREKVSIRHKAFASWKELQDSLAVSGLKEIELEQGTR